MNQLQFGIRVGMNARQYHTEAIRLQNRQVALNQAMARSPQSAKQATQGLAQLERQTDRTASSLQRIAHYSAVGYAGFQLLDMTKRTAVEMSNTAAQIQDVRVRLVGLTQSTQDYINVEQYLIGLSDRHNKNQLVLADSFSRILTLEKSGIVTRREAQQVLEGFSNIQSKAGATTEQLKQSLFGLSQGLSAGTLRAEELNQVTEPLPGLLQELDNAAGLTAGGFRKMVNDGKVTSDFFKQTLIKAFEEYEGAAAVTSDNISAAHSKHQNSYLQLVKAYETPISDTTKLVLSTSGAAMELFADNVETVSFLLGSTFVVAMSSAIGHTTRFTASKLKDVLASKAQRAATIQQLQAEVQSLTAQKAVMANKSAQIAITERLTVANQRLAAAQTTATFTTRGLSAAMSVLGGPAGLITLGASALFYFASSSEEAEQKTKSLNGQLSVLKTKFTDLTPEDVGAKMRRNQQNMISLYDAIQAKRKELEQNQNRGFDDVSKINEYNNKIRSISAEIENYESKLAKLKTENQALYELQDKLGSVNFQSNNAKPIQSQQSADELSKELAKIEQGLRTQEQVINQSYVRRRGIVEQSFATGQISQAKYNQLTLDLEVQKDEQLRQLEAQAQAKKDQAAVNARQVEDQRRKDAHADELAQLRGFKNRLLEEEQLHLDRKQAVIWENELLALRGFNSRKEAEEYAHLERKQAIIWENELLALQGFQSRKEQQEQAHQDRLLGIQLKNAGQYGGIVQQFVNFDRASGADRVATGLDIASQLTSITANQSKKAFETNKKVSIAQALVQTYLAATKALASLPPPVNFAAAGVVTAAGLANVAQIRSQKFQGQAHNGIDYVPAANEGTWKLKRGEMVMNPTQRDNFEVLLNFVKQNQTQFNNQTGQRSGSSGGNVYNFPAMTVEIKNDNSTPESQAENAEKMYRIFMNKLVSDIDKNGPVGRAIKTSRVA